MSFDSARILERERGGSRKRINGQAHHLLLTFPREKLVLNKTTLPSGIARRTIQIESGRGREEKKGGESPFKKGEGKNLASSGEGYQYERWKLSESDWDSRIGKG